MKEKLYTDLWLEYWNLYDWACWTDYLTSAAIKREFEKSEYNLRVYLHDNILIPAIEQIENNLEKIDGYSKFLYWFRFREEFRLVTEAYNLDYKNDLDKQVTFKYNEYINHLDGLIKEFRPKSKPDFIFFKWFYIGISSLKSDAEIYFNEILFNLPIFNQTEINKRNLELLEEERKDKIVNIYNYGSIDTIINHLETLVNPNRLKNSPSNNEVVELIIDNFKNQIENNRLFKLLYEGKQKKLRHESSAQQLFFSVAQIFCLANDLDVSPETNSGSGSVDFKFSQGAFDKINVEIKYSNHSRLKHGLESQLTKYDKAESTVFSYYLVIQVNDKNKIIEDIKALDNTLNPDGPRVKIVDGRYAKSASVS